MIHVALINLRTRQAARDRYSGREELKAEPWARGGDSLLRLVRPYSFIDNELFDRNPAGP
jgi:hypothetical protein